MIGWYLYPDILFYKGGIHLTQAPPICCGFAKLFFGNAIRMITVECMSYRPYFYSCHHIKQHSTCCGHCAKWIPRLSFNLALASSIENEIGEFAKRKYPNDSRMQQYTYNKQVAAYNYLLTVKDLKVKEFASRKYPNDYAMQKYTYDKQLAAKRYMQTVGDIEIKKFSVRKYPYDYAMQKYTYDKQLSAKMYMDSVSNQGAKNKAIRKYPYDYSMQKYTYDKLAY